jgi:hypothetical protein
MTRPITRRTLLRRTATFTTGVVAASTISAASPIAAGSEGRACVNDTVARDHDPETGEIFDRDRHHHWDTV